MSKPIVWSPSTVRAILARAGRTRAWLHEQLLERGECMSLSTLYNWTAVDPKGRPDDEIVAMIRGITDELKETTK